MDIKDARALITGGSVGIGLETAKLITQHGGQCVICGRDNDRLQAAAKEAGCHGIQADVSKEADVVRLVEETIAHFGTFNTLVNNAGFGIFGPLMQTSVEDMESVYRTNVFGAMAAARECAKHFVDRNYGNILNVGSTAGDKGFAMGGVYASSKAALKSMTESWRLELRSSNIRVVLVKPSEVVTEFAKKVGYPQEDSDRKLHGIDIAYAILHTLQQPDVGLIPEIPIWANNPPG